MGNPAEQLSALAHHVALGGGGHLPPVGRPPKRIPDVLDVEECEGMARHAAKRQESTPFGRRIAHRDEALVLFLWGTGCRVSEACTPILADVDGLHSDGGCTVKVIDQRILVNMLWINVMEFLVMIQKNCVEHSVNQPQLVSCLL